jgi:hypothetical protein
MPEALPGDQVVLFGAYDGDAVATATVVGQDEVTGTTRVVVTPGVAPLYVVLSSYNSPIWRFEGAVERVRRVVLVGPHPQGVTGVAADHVVDLTMSVSSLDETRCFWPFTDVQSPQAVAARGVMERVLGTPVAVFAAGSVGAVSLPSGRTETSPPSHDVPPGFDPTEYQAAIFFTPGGVVAVDPADVVPAGRAELYVVLPEGFGLAQLVASGSLEVRNGAFYIVEPIPRFPAGLYGGLSVKFVLARGVPYPPGSPGHSCVVSEATGRPLTDATLCDLR